MNIRLLPRLFLLTRKLVIISVLIPTLLLHTDYWRYSNISAGEVTTVDHLDMTATFPNGRSEFTLIGLLTH